MRPFLFQHFGNPSSAHGYGKTCRQAVDSARQQVAMLLGAQPEEVCFTSCGTESNNWAIRGAVAAWQRQNPGSTPHVITSSIEHPAVLECLDAMVAQVRAAPVTATHCRTRLHTAPAVATVQEQFHVINRVP